MKQQTCCKNDQFLNKMYINTIYKIIYKDNLCKL